MSPTQSPRISRNKITRKATVRGRNQNSYEPGARVQLVLRRCNKGGWGDSAATVELAINACGYVTPIGQVSPANSSAVEYIRTEPYSPTNAE